VRPAAPANADVLETLATEAAPGEFTSERSPAQEALHEARLAGDSPKPVVVQPVLAAPFQITEPGVYDLAPEVYFADPVPGGSLSNSGVKKLMPPGSPARYRYDVDNGVTKTSDAFDLGHCVHKLALGKGEEIAVRPEEFDSYRTKAAQAWLAEQREARRIPVTPEQHEQARAMADALLAHDYAGRLLRQPGRAEMALFWVDAETQVWRRILVDYLPDKPAPGKAMLIVDVKTAESCSPDLDMSKKVYNYGYHRQSATAMDGALALGLAETVRFFDLFVEKQPPYFVSVVEHDERLTWIGRYENRLALEVFAQCQATGVWPGPPNAIGLDALPPPGWVERIFEDAMEIH